MRHMAAISVSRGKHHVVDQGRRLSTPFAAPRRCGGVRHTGGQLISFLADVDGMAWSDVDSAKSSLAAGSAGDYAFARAIVSNLNNQTTKGMGAAALERARNQAVRDAIQNGGESLAEDAWQVVHCSTPWTMLASFGPASATLYCKAPPCILDIAAADLI